MRGVDVPAIAEILVAAGQDPGLAERWAAAGRRAGLVELYCRVGLWHPDAAEAAESVGLGVGALAHYQRRSSEDTLAQLDEAISWYDSEEAAGAGYDPADLGAARACLEAVRARHAVEASAGEARSLPLPWEVEENWLPRYRQPRAWIAVTLVETTEGVLEVWPGDDDSYLADPATWHHGDEDDEDIRPGPCRLHRGVRLDDLDAVSVLEDFLEEHVRTGRGLVHWEPTTVYVPGCDGQVPALVGLVFGLDADDANWRYTSP